MANAGGGMSDAQPRLAELVGALSLATDLAAGLSEAARDALHSAGLLHDLGRISVPNGIWDKPGPLNTVEWERVRPSRSTTSSKRNRARRPNKRLQRALRGAAAEPERWAALPLE